MLLNWRNTESQNSIISTIRILHLCAIIAQCFPRRFPIDKNMSTYLASFVESRCKNDWRDIGWAARLRFPSLCTKTFNSCWIIDEKTDNKRKQNWTSSVSCCWTNTELNDRFPSPNIRTCPSLIWSISSTKQILIDFYRSSKSAHKRVK